jgi:chorismate dehydratase
VARPRIGCVPYLNGRPLIYGLEDEVVKAPPATLVRLLRARLIDVALAPSVTLFDSDDYQVIPGICISSRGPVRSIMLFHLRRPERLRTVVVDNESRASAMLLKVLLAKRYGVTPEYIPSWRLSLKSSRYDAQLLIGDKAMLHRDVGRKLDLGEAWDEFVQLPFTYALWIARRGVELGDTAERLHAAKRAGLANLERIVAVQTVLPKKLVRQYYAENVRYDFGDDELFGFQLFARMCVELGLTAKEAAVDFCG